MLKQVLVFLCQVLKNVLLGSRYSLKSHVKSPLKSPFKFSLQVYLDLTLAVSVTNLPITGKKVYEAIKESAFHTFESYVARKQILEGGDIGKVCHQKDDSIVKL